LPAGTLRYLLIILMMPFGLMAQNQQPEKIYIAGFVVDADSLQPVPFVHIINKSRKTGSYSNEDGYFGLEIYKTDTLVFTSVGFHDTELSFLDSTKSEYNKLSVVMFSKTYTLKPVDVYAYNLEEILKKKEEPVSMERSKPEQVFEKKKPVEKPTVGFGTDPYGNAGASLQGGITALANLFNNDYQQRQKLKEILEQEEAERKIKEEQKRLSNRYREAVKENTRLKKGDLNQFINLYHPTYQFLRKASLYDLAFIISEDYKEYRRKYKYDEISLNELLEETEFQGETKD